MIALRTDLARAKGYWPLIARHTGVDYFTVARIARGETADPRIGTYSKIREWIDTHQDLLTTSPDEAA